MKKKILGLSAVVVIIAIIAAGGTLAFFSAADTAHNKITFGSLDIELVSELKAKPTDSGDAFVTKIENVMPGAVYDSRVTVKNVSSGHGAWVRLRLTSAWTNVVNAPIPENPFESFGSFKKAIYPAEYNFNVGDGAEQWSFDGGWWYYNSPLAAGEEAKPLFTKIEFTDEGMDNRYENSSFNIEFYAQAVQSENNADFAGATWRDVEGWPLEKQ